MKSFHYLVVAAVMIFLPSAGATVVVLMEGRPGSPIVTISVTGSGTFPILDDLVAPGGFLSYPDDLGWGGSWSGSFATGFNSGDGLNRGDGAPLQSGAIFLTTDSGTFPVSEINIDPDSASFTGTPTPGSDDLAFSIAPQFFPVLGSSYSISGSGTFDLNAMQPGVTFDNFIPGVYTAIPGPENLNSTAIVFTIKAIPEPTTWFMATFSGVLMTRRKR